MLLTDAVVATFVAVVVSNERSVIYGCIALEINLKYNYAKNSQT